MNRIKYIAILTILLLSVAGVCVAQNTGWRATPKTVDKVKNYLAKLDKLGYNGAVLVAIDGKAVVSRGFGFSDEERRVKNSPQTVFDIGSVTKQFTAAAILKLEMQGKLSTADPITKYFERVPPDKASITIHELLRHSAGLPSVVGGDFDKISEAEFVEKVFSAPLRFPVGTRFGYSNVGYSLLALVIEKVSGQTYEQYLYENLWKPAGMEATGYTRPRFDANLIANGYRNRERWGKPTEKAWDTGAPYLHLKGNGGILSTTEDLFKWDQALLTDKILSRAAKEKYYHPQLRENETEKSFYAYGWDAYQTDRSTRRIWHNGTNRVFFADFYRFIDDRVTIIALTNKWQESFVETGRILSRIIFYPAYEPVMPVPDTAANRAFTDEIIKLTLEKGLPAATASYRRRDKNLGLLEMVVNQKGYDLMEEKRLKEAIEIFKLNVYAFPKSANAFDSLGEAYLESGDKAAAVEHYRKSLQLNPENENAREVLKKIESQ